MCLRLTICFCGLQDRECPSADYSCIIAADSLLLKIVPVLECLLTCCQLGD